VIISDAPAHGTKGIMRLYHKVKREKFMDSIKCNNGHQMWKLPEVD
jgi:hypothetical protein